MNSRTTPSFWVAYGQLPTPVKVLVRRAYRLSLNNPQHPSLRFKRVHPVRLIYSVRIGLGWRAVGIMPSSNEVLWFWIGSHADYNKLLKSL